MSILSIAQATAYATQAGFTGLGKQIIVAIAQAESSLNTMATNKNPGGSVDRGVLQINNYYHSEVSDECAFDPICAFQQAFKISDNGKNFNPWTTFTNGSYTKYMGSAPSDIQWPDWMNVITQGYNPAGGEYGVDIGAPYHSPVYALWGGKVLQAGRTQWSSDVNNTSGGMISILSDIPGLGQRVYYTLHMDTIANGITVGSQIQPGQLLGLSGGQNEGGQWPASTKFSSGPHIEIGFNAPFSAPGPGTNVNPIDYIRQAMSNTNPTSTSTTGASFDKTSDTPPDWTLGIAQAINDWPANTIKAIAESDFVQRGFLIFVGLVFVLLGIAILFFGNGGMKAVV